MGTRTSVMLLILLVIGGVIALGSLRGTRRGSSSATAPDGSPSAQREDDLLPKALGYFAKKGARSVAEQTSEAVANGKRAIVQAYDNETEPNRNLRKAAFNGDVARMQEWLEKGADANAAGDVYLGDMRMETETALMCAVRSGKPAAVRLLLPRMTEEGKKARNRGGATALVIARGLRNVKVGAVREDLPDQAEPVAEVRRFEEIVRMLEEVGVPDSR